MLRKVKQHTINELIVKYLQENKNGSVMDIFLSINDYKKRHGIKLIQRSSVATKVNILAKKGILTVHRMDKDTRKSGFPRVYYKLAKK